jgi:death-on-curing protein
MDGNKRVGYVLCRVFLLRSGWDFTATQEEKYLMFYGVAAGQVSEEELAAWLRTRLIATESS